MSVEPPPEDKLIILDITGPTLTEFDSLDLRGKWISLRITDFQGNFSHILSDLFTAEADHRWDVRMVEVAELVILEPPHSAEPGSGWEQAADYPRHLVYTYLSSELPERIAKALSLMTSLDYLHLQFDGLTIEQANKFSEILVRRSDKWKSVQILRLSGISRQASNIHCDILRNNRVPNLVGLDMGGIPAGSPLWDTAARQLRGLKRLAVAVYPGQFPRNPAPTMEGFKHWGGGVQGFKRLEWLAIDEFQPRDDEKEVGDYFKIKRTEFIAHLKFHLPSLTRLRFTIRKKPVQQVGMVNFMLSEEAFDKWYTGILEDFQQNMPNLESICIFSDWPWYYEGGSRLKTIEKKDARELPVRGMWPVGLRDDTPGDGLEDDDTVMGDSDPDGDTMRELGDVKLEED